MRLNNLLSVAAIAMLLPCFTSCHDDDDPTPETSKIAMPSTNFGSSIDEIKSSETAKGFTVSETDDSHLTAVKTDGGKTISIVYTFDPTSKEYRYAKCSYDSDDQTALVKQLTDDGYKADASSNGVSFYTNTTSNAEIVFDTDKKEYFAAPSSLDALAWGRFDYLDAADKAGLIVPYLGKYAPVELVELNEKFHGNTLDTKNSKVDNGVYVFNVAANDKGYTQIRYWFDVKTKSRLEEAAVYFDADKRPSTSEVTAYMNYLGLQYTAMTDQSDGSSIYFNYDRKFEAYLLMDKPSDESKTFTPNIHFAFTDLTDQLPPANVDMPDLVLDFNTLTLDEAVEQYKKMPYYTGTADDGFGGELGIFVKTSSKYFPQFLLMQDNGKYISVVLIPDDVKVLRSPSIKDWLAKNDYEYDSSASVLPTYVRKDKKVMVQFDMDGMLTGVPCLAFEPCE